MHAFIGIVVDAGLVLWISFGHSSVGSVILKLECCHASQSQEDNFEAKQAKSSRGEPPKDKDKETSWIGTINVKMRLQVTGALELMEETPYIKTAFDAAPRTIAQGANQEPFKLTSLTTAF